MYFHCEGRVFCEINYIVTQLRGNAKEKTDLEFNNKFSCFNKFGRTEQMFCFHFLCGEKIPFRNFKVTCATKKARLVPSIIHKKL
jgi:hypothetical protein